MKPPNSLIKPELLSPAGDRECLLAAIKNGADAVYLGVKDFNARLYSRNFSSDELAKAVDYSHRHGVRVYLTLNTLVKNHELNSFFNVLSRAYSAGIDGVIIQHVSFLNIIKRNFPGLAVFMSTQAAIGNPSAASLVKSADRIILPRELTLDEIKAFKAVNIRTEVFIHGALCYSYSGMCLFSSFVGSRSGNRGSCAQLCRQKYNNSYPLSTRELCLVKRIPELINAGVSGFKIEGRMRSPLYVAVATRLYRQAIDSYLSGAFKVPEQEMADIEVVFSRDFTEGFAAGDTHLTSPEKPMNRGAFLGTVKNGEMSVRRPVAAGDGIGIWHGNEVSGSILKNLFVGGKKVDAAKTGDAVNLGGQAEDGSRVYLTSSPRIKMEPDFTINRPPVTQPKLTKISPRLPAIKPGASTSNELMVKVYSLTEAREASQAGADIVFLNIYSPDFPERRDWQERAGIGAYLPRILAENEVYNAIELLRKKSPDAVMSGNLGFLRHRTAFGIPVYADYSLNTFNDQDISFLKQLNVTPVMSPELSLKELISLQNKDVVIFCHGDIVLVNTKIDPGTEKLADEKSAVFPVRRENSYWQILNSRPFGLFNDIQQLLDTGFTRFYIDRQDHAPESIAIYRKILEHKFTNRNIRKGYTSGHLYKPVL